MRFDYQIPNTSTFSFHDRPRRKKKLALLLLALLGVYNFSPAFFVKKQRLSPEEVIARLNTNVEQQQLDHLSKMASLTESKKSGLLQNINRKIKSTLSLDIIGEDDINPILPDLKPSEEWKKVLVNKGDSVARIFADLGVSSATLNKITTSHPAGKKLSNIHPGQTLEFLFDENQELLEIRLQVSSIKTLHIRATTTGFKYYYEEKELIKRIGFATGLVEDSLYMTAQNAGLNDKLIMQMAEIFSWDIDFSQDIRHGDSFRVIFEEEYIENEKINSGEILAVEFINNGKQYKAVRYTNINNRSGYYSPEGYSLQKAFLRNPVKYVRISSHFSEARNHPVLHKIRAHKGVDYAAAKGTPIIASSDGKVSFRGQKGGYGNSIEISHGMKYSTFYAHLSRFHPKVKKGTFVKQGQIIGYVGRSGLATGDHLHYEFRINGIHRDPLKVKLPRSLPVPDKERSEFSTHAQSMLRLLDTQTNLFFAQAKMLREA